MSFGDLFRPLKQWNKASYKVEVIKDSKAKPALKMPASSNTSKSNSAKNTAPYKSSVKNNVVTNPKVHSISSDNSALNIPNDWQKTSVVLKDLSQRVHRLLEGESLKNDKPFHINVIDFADTLDHSVYSWFQQIVASHDCLMSYKLTGLLDESSIDKALELHHPSNDEAIESPASEISNGSMANNLENGGLHKDSFNKGEIANAIIEKLSNDLQQWSDNQEDFSLDVILLWNSFQYFDELQIKRIMQILTNYSNPHTLVHILNCEYLKDNNSTSVKFKFLNSIDGSDIPNQINHQDNKNKVKLSAIHRSPLPLTNLILSNPASYSLGNIPGLLLNFELVKVNIFHDPSISECLAKKLLN